MYDESLILDYQLKLLTLELNDGFRAYDNLNTVLRYYNKYGCTEDFRELIGEENIIEAAGGAIKKFYEWLKRKITEIIQKIKEFFHRLKVRICKLLGIKVNDTPSPNDTKQLIQVTNNLSIIRDKTVSELCISNTSGRAFSLPYNSSVSGRNLTIPWDLDKIFTLERDLYHIGEDMYIPEENSAAMIEQFKTLCQPDSDKMYTYDLAKIKTLAVDIYEFAINTIVYCNTATEKLDKFKTVVDKCATSTSMSDNERAAIISRSISDILIEGARISQGYLYGSSLRQMSIGSAMDYARSCITTVTQCIRLKSKLANIALMLIIQLDRVYNASSKAVYLEYKIDSEFARDLQNYIMEYFHIDSSEFHPRYLIVTSISPYAWLTGDKDEISKNPSIYPIGWAPTNMGQSGVYDCYINYRAHQATFEKIPITPTHPHIQSLMGTVVHECTHIFDAQNNQEFEYGDDHDDVIQEQRAIAMEKNFKRNEHHMRWLCDVVRNVRSKVRR